MTDIKTLENKVKCDEGGSLSLSALVTRVLIWSSGEQTANISQ